MEEILKTTLLGLFFGTFGTTCGGVIGCILNKISNKLLSFILAFASGLMMSIICFDLIPEALEISTLFNVIFGIVIGIVAAVIYRVSNTMDAMLGYKTKELINIGCYPAKLDDVLNYIPARLTGYYVVLASFILRYDYRQSYDVMKKFALKTPSPNSGYPMAATAGALNITLVKEDVYTLGYGTDELNREKISKAINITKLTSLLFILTIVVIYFIVMFLVL